MWGQKTSFKYFELDGINYIFFTDHRNAGEEYDTLEQMGWVARLYSSLYIDNREFFDALLSHEFLRVMHPNKFQDFDNEYTLEKLEYVSSPMEIVEDVNIHIEELFAKTEGVTLANNKEIYSFLHKVDMTKPMGHHFAQMNDQYEWKEEKRGSQSSRSFPPLWDLHLLVASMREDIDSSKLKTAVSMYKNIAAVKYTLDDELTWQLAGKPVVDETEKEEVTNLYKTLLEVAAFSDRELMAYMKTIPLIKAGNHEAALKILANFAYNRLLEDTLIPEISMRDHADILKDVEQKLYDLKFLSQMQVDEILEQYKEKSMPPEVDFSQFVFAPHDLYSELGSVGGLGTPVILFREKYKIEKGQEANPNQQYTLQDLLPFLESLGYNNMCDNIFYRIDNICTVDDEVKYIRSLGFSDEDPNDPIDTGIADWKERIQTSRDEYDFTKDTEFMEVLFGKKIEEEKEET